MDHSNEATKLAAEIIRHRMLYYSGQPEINDHEFDKLEEKLRLLDPLHPVLYMLGNLENVNDNKVIHKKPMLSLAKTYNYKDLKSWQKNRDLVGTPKIDGISLSLSYQKGSLNLAKTRGNGVEGEDVTSRVLWVKGCIAQVDLENIDENLRYLVDTEFEVRGELFCYQKNFALLISEMEKLGLERPSNPRNIVAGVMGRKAHLELTRFFDFLAFDLIVSEKNHKIDTEIKKLDCLHQLGFSLPEYKLISSDDDPLHYLKNIKQKIEENELALDGAVFTYNCLKIHDELGETSHHPRYKLAYKWQGETAKSQIKKITWSTSRLGIVTPVAEIEAVELSGAMISNVTLHNYSFVKNFNIKKGDIIEIVRSGEVIPKFLSVVKATNGLAIIPKSCESCDSTLISDDVKLFCPNKKCSNRILYRILNWIYYAGIEDLSEKRLKQLISLKGIENIHELYSIDKSDLLQLPNTKEKLATKLYLSIQESKNMSLLSFLCGLGIMGIGKNSWKLIIEKASSLDKIRALQVEEIESIKGFANKTSKQIVDGLALLNKEIDCLLALGIKIKESSNAKKQDLLSGKTFVITGSLSKARSLIIKDIEDAGGKVSSSVSSNTSILLINDLNSNSSKAKKAKELKIEFWSESDLENRLQKNKG